jgi:hypothetical protein
VVGNPVVGVSCVLVRVTRGDAQDRRHGLDCPEQVVVAVTDERELVEAGEVVFAAGGEAPSDLSCWCGDVDEDTAAFDDLSYERGHVLVGEACVSAVDRAVDQFAEEAAVEDEATRLVEQVAVGVPRLLACSSERRGCGIVCATDLGACRSGGDVRLGRHRADGGHAKALPVISLARRPGRAV